MYSRVHKSSDSFFSKILEKSILSAEKNDTSYKLATFFTEMKQKNIQNFDRLVLGLVELIAKDIRVSQLIRSKTA